MQAAEVSPPCVETSTSSSSVRWQQNVGTLRRAPERHRLGVAAARSPERLKLARDTIKPRPQQIGRFGSGCSHGTISASAWPELPAEARGRHDAGDQLVLDHAAMAAMPPAKEVDP